MAKTFKKFAIGTLVAGAAGYVAGILTAPRSGKETREELKVAALRAKTDAERNLKKMHSQLSDVINQGNDRLKVAKSRAKTELQSAIDSAVVAKEKARTILSAIHEGDAEDEDLDKAVKEVNKALTHLKSYLQKNGQKTA